MAEVLVQIWLAYEGMARIDFLSKPPFWTHVAMAFLNAIGEKNADKGGTQEIPIGPNKIRRITRM